jgi:hypothetical protein
MKDPRQSFEALMRGSGYSDKELEKNEKGTYILGSVHTRWKYFLLGWEMRGLI